MSRPRSVLPPGTELAARYRVEAVLGQGGSSIVYAAADRRSGEAVALKVLDPEPEHRATERARLLREARLCAGLRHEGIVRVLDAGVLDDGAAYLAMERLEGRTLAERLDGCFWLPLEEATALAVQLLAALDAAHAHGVVHRDIKPSNVFLLGEGSAARLKLIDFGIGRDLGDPGSRVTEPEVVVGTVGYMAPEQLFGDEPTVRSDVYAVGATLYEMFVGRPPHEVVAGDVRAVLHAMVEAPAPLEALRPAVPASLASGVMRALAKKPTERHPSVRAMARACGLDVAAAA